MKLQNIRQIAKSIYERVQYGPYPSDELMVRVGRSNGWNYFKIPNNSRINFWGRHTPRNGSSPDFGTATCAGIARVGPKDPLFMFKLGSNFHKMINSSEAPAFEYIAPAPVRLIEGDNVIPLPQRDPDYDRYNRVITQRPDVYRIAPVRSPFLAKRLQALDELSFSK